MKHSKSDLELYLSQIEEMVTLLRAGYKPALERCRYAARDGYPSSSMSTDGGSSSGVSDPVGELATNSPMVDPVARQGEQLRNAIYRARCQLEIAAGAQAQLLATPQVETARINTIPDCVNCGDPIPGKVRAGRCGRCWQFRRRNRGLEWKASFSNKSQNTIDMAQ